MNANLFRARLDAEFRVPLLTVGWNCLYQEGSRDDLGETRSKMAERMSGATVWSLR